MFKSLLNTNTDIQGGRCFRLVSPTGLLSDLASHGQSIAVSMPVSVTNYFRSIREALRAKKSVRRPRAHVQRCAQHHAVESNVSHLRLDWKSLDTAIAYEEQTRWHDTAALEEEDKAEVEAKREKHAACYDACHDACHSS